MQPRIPRQSTRDHAAHRTDGAPGLEAESAAALAAARRRAVRDGDRQIDTAHLLHSLLEHDPRVRAAFGGGPQLARLLGYLVQRSIGYGLRWQSGVEDSGALPVVPDVRGAGALHAPTALDDARALPAALSVEGFSPLAAAALDRARASAVRRGGAAAGGVDLLAAIVADPEARAVEVLTRAGVDLCELRARITGGPEADSPAADAPGTGGPGRAGLVSDGLEECAGGGEAARWNRPLPGPPRP
ncbi:Clp protease N-terminal domain-containing protein [Streptomyces sp. NPDC000345]|uniref:Clp protease N-terminal domain-containing protein n=1 Tax=Streptomyces sp. NPDC000345 TaxID=3364537 RepID=UPI0036843665